MEIHYQIQFHTDWHCGSGLAAGADLDALVVKDKDGLPFIPGKTIKGLVREAVEDMRSIQGKDSDDDFANGFGYFEKDKERDKGKVDAKKDPMFFTNAELPEEERNAIVANNAARFLFRSVSNTAIDKNGIAKKHSLRKMQVVVPCTLEGKILHIPDGLKSDIKDALKYIKRLGQNRNRGMGRCTFIVKEEEEK